MGKCKTKATQTDLGTFSHNQSYPGIIQAYSWSILQKQFTAIMYSQIIIVSQYTLAAFSTSWNKYEVVTPEVVILFKKTRARKRAGDLF